MRRLLITTSLIAAIASGPTAAGALASSAQQDGYPPIGDVKTNEVPGATGSETKPTQSTATPTTTSTSALPFTGLEAGLIALAGIGLVGVGVTLRRAGAPRTA